MNKFELALQTQQELLNYIISTNWKEDQEKQQLEVIFQKVQSNCNIKLDIDQFFTKDKQEQLESYLYEKQQQIRKIYKSLQETLNKQTQLKQSTTCVISQLPPRLKNNKESYLQQMQLHQFGFYNYFKKNYIELKSCYSKLSQNIILKQKREPIQKEINLLELAENFKFELNYLETEMMQNRHQLGEQFDIIKNSIQITIEDGFLQNLLVYCTTISKANILLKKQFIIVKQIYSCDIKQFYWQIVDADKENKQTSYSQDTDITNQQLSLKNYDQNHAINNNIRNQHCLCTIF